MRKHRAERLRARRFDSGGSALHRRDVVDTCRPPLALRRRGRRGLRGLLANPRPLAAAAALLPRSRMWPRVLPSLMHMLDLQYLKPSMPLQADAWVPVHLTLAAPAHVPPSGCASDGIHTCDRGRGLERRLNAGNGWWAQREHKGRARQALGPAHQGSRAALWQGRWRHWHRRAVSVMGLDFPERSGKPVINGLGS